MAQASSARSKTESDPLARKLIDELIDLGGAGMVVTTIGQGDAPHAGLGVVRVGVHRGGPPPCSGLEAFDILLSADPDAPAPWVGIAPERLKPTLAQLAHAIARQPLAAGVAAQVLRMSLSMTFDDALCQESVAYSMLLGSSPFHDWRAATPVRRRTEEPAPRVRIAPAADGVLELRLDRRATRNAFDARMRDELAEALAFAIAHPDAPPVVLRGEGPAFSGGGDLDEFGQGEPGAAHLIRILRSPARLVRDLADRMTMRLHGACIGAGIEIPAAARRVTARAGTFFRLPEVSMGLIPGAGGTATIPRRIGRQRACYMALSGVDIDLLTALTWGLVDEVEA